MLFVLLRILYIEFILIFVVILCDSYFIIFFFVEVEIEGLGYMLKVILVNFGVMVGV